MLFNEENIVCNGIRMKIRRLSNISRDACEYQQLSSAL